MAILMREHFQQVCDLFPELSEQLSKVSQERIHRVEMLEEEKRQGTDGVEPPGPAPRRGSWVSKTSSNTSLRKAARLLFARLGRATRPWSRRASAQGASTCPWAPRVQCLQCGASTASWRSSRCCRLLE
jgi:hypothetical protein